VGSRVIIGAVKLEDLRHREDEVRALLADVREQLGVAVATIEKAERAREQVDARERTKSEGAYRDVAAEHAAELHAQMSGAEGAAVQRERLRREEARLLDQLEQTRAGMEQLGVRKNVLPVFDGIPAAAPCAVRWDEMNGNGDARTCGHCKLTVVNVSMSDPARAEELVAACGGDAKFHRRCDGTILARDCPAGVARRRFFARAPLVIVAVMVVTGGVALALANEREHEPSVRRVPPPSMEPGQFGSTRPQVPTPPPPPTTVPPRTLTLHGAASLAISDGFDTLGGSTSTSIDLTRSGDTFTAKLSCSFFRSTVSHTRTIPAATVDAFLAAAESHTARSVTEGRCNHTDDYPHIRVTVGVTPAVDLTVDNCSYQWHADGVTLDDVPHESSSPFESSMHPDINTAYRAMLAAVGKRACLDEARRQKQPSPPRIEQTERPRNCNPPYTIVEGTKVWRPECM
jgi:hypothetical protein